MRSSVNFRTCRNRQQSASAPKRPSTRRAGMRLIFRVSSIAGLCLGLSRRTSRVRACFSRVHLAQKWAPKRTASGGFSFPPDDDEEFRGGRGKRVSRPPATKKNLGFSLSSRSNLNFVLRSVPRISTFVLKDSNTNCRYFKSLRDGLFVCRSCPR